MRPDNENGVVIVDNCLHMSRTYDIVKDVSRLLPDSALRGKGKLQQF